MALLASCQPQMAKTGLKLTATRDTPEEWAAPNGLVLDDDQMMQRGLRVHNFSTDELAKLRRCQLCSRTFAFVCHVLLHSL